MTVVPFDTLALARKLREKAHFTPEEAEGTAEALAEAMAGSDLATKADLNELKHYLETKIQDLERRLEARFEARFAAIDARFAAIDVRFAAIEAKMKDLELRLTLRIGAMIAGAVALLVAVDKLT